MKTERLTVKADALGAAYVQQVTDQLMATPLPRGVRAERRADGVTLVGKNLRLWRRYRRIRCWRRN